MDEKIKSIWPSLEEIRLNSITSGFEDGKPVFLLVADPSRQAPQGSPNVLSVTDNCQPPSAIVMGRIRGRFCCTRSS